MAYGTLRADTIESTAGLTLTQSGTGKTITLAGDFTTSGAYACTLTLTGATNVTLPTSGTIPNTTDVSNTAKATAIGLDFIFGF